MKQKIVGTYYMGWEQVELVIREGDGGEFYFCPEDGKIARIKIGVDEGCWRDVVSTLLHEVYEFIITRENCRYTPSNDLSRDHGSYIMVLSHTQLSSCCSKAADFISSSLPDLAKAYKEWKRRK